MRKIKDCDYMVLIYRALAVLICSVLLTTHMVAGLFAKYTYKETSLVTARVAKFDILGEGTFTDEFVANVAPGEAEQLIAQIDIGGNLEVAANISIDVVNVTKNIPYEYKLKKLVGDDYVDVDSFSFEYYPSSGNANYRLFIYIPEDDELPDSNLAYRGMVDYIKIAVTAKQID